MSHRTIVGIIAHSLAPNRRRILSRNILAAAILVSLSVCLFPPTITGSVSVAGTITIKPDGSVEPPGAPIYTNDNITYVLTSDISDSICIRRSNIVFDGAQHKMHGTGDSPGIFLIETINVTVRNVEIKGYFTGIQIWWSSNATILANNITANRRGLYLEGENYVVCMNSITANAWEGILMYSGVNSLVTGNDISNNGRGIGFEPGGGQSNLVTENNITGNGVGIDFTYRVDFHYYENKIYHNNFENTVQVHVPSDSMVDMLGYWDNGYPSGGNYWSDLNPKADFRSGPRQDVVGSDGIVDVPYIIDVYSRDSYPLAKPYYPQRIQVYTDRVEYWIGWHQKLGLHVTNMDGKTNVCFAVWTQLPNSSIYVYMHMHNVTLQADFSYNNPAWRTLQLPGWEDDYGKYLGSYVWHAAFLDPATHAILVEDTAQFWFEEPPE